MVDARIAPAHTHAPAAGGGAVPIVQVRSLTVAHGPQVVLHDMNFSIWAGEIFVILGASGSGKSSLLRNLIGLQPPDVGQVLIEGHNLYDGDETTLQALRRRFGVMFQAGALWSAMSVGENVMLPMQMFSTLSRAERRRSALAKLALVGLQSEFDRMPAALSGGMRKRAALARALALDPPLLFLDEPGSGLDPLNAARLDALVRRLRDQLATTVVMVTHDIDSALHLADRILFLDESTRTMTALDTPQALVQHGPPNVREFLQRGRMAPAAEGPGSEAPASEATFAAAAPAGPALQGGA